VSTSRNNQVMLHSFFSAFVIDEQCDWEWRAEQVFSSDYFATPGRDVGIESGKVDLTTMWKSAAPDFES
jgi:hypothetical protein